MSEMIVQLPHLSPDLSAAILKVSVIKDIPKGTVILKEGQYVKAVPLVADGLIKVFSSFEERELLLYYIQPSQSCIMSFTASLRNEPSRIFALAEENTTVVLIPADKVAGLTGNFPDMNNFFYSLFNQRYLELLDTISHVLFKKMDERLYDYLFKKVTLSGQNPVKISHSQIANELGTVREVISRVMKKLETEGKVQQHTNSVNVLFPVT